MAYRGLGHPCGGCPHDECDSDSSLRGVGRACRNAVWMGKQSALVGMAWPQDSAAPHSMGSACSDIGAGDPTYVAWDGKLARRLAGPNDWKGGVDYSLWSLCIGPVSVLSAIRSL